MSITTTTHLNFRGQAREALEFYASVTGGRVDAMSYADANAVTAPDEADQLMWGQVVSEAGFRVMAYDVPAHTAYDPGTIPVFVSLRGSDADELHRLWDGLSGGGGGRRAPGPGGLVAPLRDAARSLRVTFVVDLEVAWG